MFKPHRIVFSALPLLMLCVALVFLKTSSQSLPQAKLFAEGVINTDADEYGPAFTSDGKTLYFTRRVNRRDSEFIYVSQLESGKWSAPALAPFSGKHFDKEPFVAPDGQRIFFASLRPVDGVEPIDFLFRPRRRFWLRRSLYQLQLRRRAVYHPRRRRRARTRDACS
jgi:hypothetical protein